MQGLIALVGSGEYLPLMDEIDRYLLENSTANGHVPRVVCLPTAAGREGEASIRRWSKMGVDHFTRLGADVRAVEVIDGESANDPENVTLIEEADLVYFSGGDPGYLHQTLKNSRAWEAVQKTWMRGAAYAGCSAGAMVLGREIPDFRALGLRSIPAFGLLPAAFIIPHFNALSGIWKPLIFSLRRRLEQDAIMIGVDEETAVVGRMNEPWTIMGNGRAHVFTRDGVDVYSRGEAFHLGK